MKCAGLAKLMVWICVAGLTAGINQVASAQVITSIERRYPDDNSGDTEPVLVVGGLAEMTETFVDRPHAYVNVPSSLVGIDYVKVANDDKDNPNYELDVTMGQDATLILFIDDRVGDNDNTNPPTIGSGTMNWVLAMGFVDTGLQIDIDEYPATDPDIDQHFSIYSLEVPAGTKVTLLEQNDGTTRNMYGVAAIQGSLNLPPVVDAGSAQIIVWPENAVQLDATVTDDGKPVFPGKVTLIWSVQSSPDESTVQFEPNEFCEDPVATFDKAGTYVLCITANDGLLSESDCVTITVKEPDCPLGDLNRDCRVDWQDLKILAGQWLSDPVCWGFGCPDLDADDLVNLVDFAWLGKNWAEKGSVLESTKLRIILTRNPYSFTITEKSSGQTLLSQKETRFILGGSGYITESAYNITVTASTMDADIVLVGTSETGHVKFSLESPEMVQVLLSCNGAPPSNIKEEFIDQGEHYYGIWEYPQGGHIDNRGADADLLGFGGMPHTNFANARAPFYVTSMNYGIYVDTVAKGHYSIAKGGKTGFDFDEEQLKYYVIYGPSYRNIMSMFNQLAGPAWMPPDWAFDSIWWRDDDHQDLGHWDLVENRLIDSAQDNVEATANHLQYYRIPTSAIWIDRPYTSGTWGWGNMDFNPAGDWFPDGVPNGQAMIDYLEAKGYKLLLWIANRCEDTLKTEGEAYGYLFTGYTSRPAADVRRPEVYDWFKDKLDTFVSMGVKGYKVDRGHEGEQPDSAENEVVYLFRKLAAEGQMDRHGNDYLIHARNCYDKNRKHIGVWNGDTQSDFGGFSVSIKNGLRCGAINFPYYGSDTGGYLSDYPSQELFTRWFQFSTYCTMMETLIDPHRTVWYDDDFPHNAEPNLIDIARKQCEEHHDLIPYTRSCMYEAHQTGMPVMRQMIFEFPYDSNLYDMWDEYMYGPGILVAPVVTGGATSRSVYLPAGKWLDYNDKDTTYTGPDTITASAPIDVIPLFVREGAVITRGDILQSNNNWTPGWAPYLRIEFFPYDNTANTFDYYTGSNVRPVACSMSDIGNVDISFLDLGYDGTLDIYCRAYTNVTKNSIPLVEGVDFTYDPVKNLMTIPFSGTTTVEITGVQSIFNPD
jgi:alpha-D-xyloside xylohydrolase